MLIWLSLSGLLGTRRLMPGFLHADRLFNARGWKRPRKKYQKRAGEAESVSVALIASGHSILSYIQTSSLDAHGADQKHVRRFSLGDLLEPRWTCV